MWYVKLLKVVNLSVKSFFDKNIQTLASSLTYTTLLAVIPILSLLLAIARGFGMRDVLIQSLYKGLPSQRAMLENSLDFVDRFLATLSKGVFVGIGVVFLLWTLVSMLRKIESVYNHVWNVRKGRPIYRRITDYTAILLIIPILLICSGGLSIFLSNFVQESINSPIGVLSPVLKFLLDLSPVFLLGVLFVGMNVLIPYTKVKLKNALLPGFVCGVLFYFIQYAFVHGQISVTKYNAVYGGFAFLPLFLIWMQLSWTVCIACAVMTYSSQNFFSFNYLAQVKKASARYVDQVALFVIATVVSRFEVGADAVGKKELADRRQIPVKMVNEVVDRLCDGGFLSAVIDDDGNISYQPSRNLSGMTVEEFMNRYHEIGHSDFIEEPAVAAALDRMKSLLDVDSEAYRTTTLPRFFESRQQVGNDKCASANVYHIVGRCTAFCCKICILDRCESAARQPEFRGLLCQDGARQRPLHRRLGEEVEGVGRQHVEDMGDVLVTDKSDHHAQRAALGVLQLVGDVLEASGVMSGVAYCQRMFVDLHPSPHQTRCSANRCETVVHVSVCDDESIFAK